MAPLNAWVRLYAHDRVFLAFTYVDPQTGPAARGGPVSNPPTALEIERAVVHPPDMLNPAALAFQPLTADEIAWCRLPPRPPWLGQAPEPRPAAPAPAAAPPQPALPAPQPPGYAPSSAGWARVPLRAVPEAARDALIRTSRGESVPGHTLLAKQPRFIGSILLFLGGSAISAAILRTLLTHQSMATTSIPDSSFPGGEYYATLPMSLGQALKVGLLAAIVAVAVWFAVFELIRLLRSRLRQAIVLTPALVVRTGLDSDHVEAARLAGVQDLRVWSKGLILMGAGGRPLMSLPGLGQAHVGTLRQALMAYGQALRQGPQDVQSVDWIDEATAGAASAKPGFGGRRLSAVGGVVVSFVLALPLAISCWLISVFERGNLYWEEALARKSSDDYGAYLAFAEDIPDTVPYELLLDWMEVEEREGQARIGYDDALYSEARTLTHYRDYARRLPKGRHLAEARNAVRKKYEEISEAYAKKALANRADFRVVRGVRDILAWLGQDFQSPKVGLHFVAANRDEINESMRLAAKVANVASVGDAFSGELQRRRELNIIESVKSAISAQFSTEELTLDAEAADTRPRFLMTSAVLPSGSVYFRVSESFLPPAQRKAFPGIFIDFDLAAQVPVAGLRLSALTRSSHLHVRATPPPRFTVQTTAGQEASDAAVYGQMAATAFDDFRERVKGGFGLTTTSAVAE